jgi:cation:H+ antiporter
MVWIKFLICAGIILLAGIRLTHYADIIEEKTGLGKAWVGLVLLATITSLPELANGISAVTVVGVPDLAVGDLLGACMMNMFTLALLDLSQLFTGRQTIFVKPAKRNILASIFALGLLLFAALSIFLSGHGIDFSVFGFSMYTLIIILIYFVAQKMIYKEEKQENNIIPGRTPSKMPLGWVVFRFLLLGLIVVAAGSWLPFIGSEIIGVMGWGKTFVGVLFLGLATTMPEMTVSFSALRMGAVSMSKGNLFGSNIFNLGLLFLVDIFYRKGSLLANVSSNMIFAALFGALLVAIAYLAMMNRGQRKRAAVSLIIVYFASLFILFRLGVS